MVNGELTDSNGNFLGRQAWLSDSGGFGKVQGGLRFSPFVLSIIKIDPRNGVSIYVGGVLGTGTYNANAISYTSPTIAGTQGSAMLAFGGIAGDFQADRQYSASLDYTHGPIMLSAAMYSGNGGGTAASTPKPSTIPFSGRTIGAGYKLANLTVKVAFVDYKIAGSFDNRVYGVHRKMLCHYRSVRQTQLFRPGSTKNMPLSHAHMRDDRI